MRTGFRCGMTVVVAVASFSACNESALAKSVKSIAKAQAVDESVVRQALQRFASTEDEMLDLAKVWEQQLPSRPVPVLAPVLVAESDEAVASAQRAFRSATCSAIVDMLSDGTVPSGQTFLDSYVEASILDALPSGEIVAIVDEFDSLYQDASAGTLTYVDVRLTLMEIRNC